MSERLVKRGARVALILLAWCAFAALAHYCAGAGWREAFAGVAVAIGGGLLAMAGLIGALIGLGVLILAACGEFETGRPSTEENK